MSYEDDIERAGELLAELYARDGVVLATTVAKPLAEFNPDRVVRQRRSGFRGIEPRLMWTTTLCYVCNGDTAGCFNCTAGYTKEARPMNKAELEALAQSQEDEGTEWARIMFRRVIRRRARVDGRASL